ncbi:hypothetical protein AC1031_002134 [Aphanomyces cochlioides]|nr:hypothetical protein AC1031_002134 [Aphanomyces cochlioides]
MTFESVWMIAQCTTEPILDSSKQRIHISFERRYVEPIRILLLTVSALHDEKVVLRPCDAVDEMNTWYSCTLHSIHDNEFWWQFVPHPDNSDKSFMTVVDLSNISRIIQHEDVKDEPTKITAEIMRIVAARRKNPDEDTPTF